jgi:hypothetical protein
MARELRPERFRPLDTPFFIVILSRSVNTGVQQFRRLALDFLDQNF